MTIILKKGVSCEEEEEFLRKLYECGVGYKKLEGEGRVLIEVESVEGIRDGVLSEELCVERVMMEDGCPYRLVSRVGYEGDGEVFLWEGGVSVGGERLLVIAGPCTVEDEEQVIETARFVKRHGGNLLRGGAYKPRSSPYSFQGHGEEGLKILEMAKKEVGLGVCTEVMDTRDVELVSRYADVLQIGARNMQNISLLKEVGRSGKAVLLKRGLSGTVEEWLMSAEYIMASGGEKVILCERGVRTFERSYRNTLDITSVLLAKELSYLPVVIDPSHASGKSGYVKALSRAGISVGADGLLIEVHREPGEALVDGFQALDEDGFKGLMGELEGIARVVGRKMPMD